jgi:predicted RNase H-like nuclease (RuvC/YqgF family)
MTFDLEQTLKLTQKEKYTMTDPNHHSPTANKNEELINSLRDEIADLKSRLTKKDDKISGLDTMLKPVMEGHHAEIRAYEDLEDKLDDVIEKLKNKVPHSVILDYLKVKDRNGFW